MDDVTGAYRLPNGEAEELPLTIEITMSVRAWRLLQGSLESRHPDISVDRIIRQAVARFNALAGSEVKLDGV